MSERAEERPAAEQPAPEGRAAAGRMGTRDLLFLAAGGVIGSGWLFTGTNVDKTAADVWALGPWLMGGLLMLVVSIVMVELSIRTPKTGGLIFLPLQTGGPLLATVVAAGVWAYYAVNPASEAAAIVQNLGAWWNWQWVSELDYRILTILLAGLFLALVTAVNLLGPRRFLGVNFAVTAIKIFVPALIVIVLLCALRFPPHPAAAFPGYPGHYVPPPQRWSAMPGAIVGSGVLYSYLGFQGPIDFAGNVKSGGMGGATRLRLAVYGTVGGSIVLYTALQCVLIYLRAYHHSTGDVDRPLSVYATFVQAVVHPSQLGRFIRELINLDSVLSPAGTALIFTYVMTREVAALSRAHLTHRGLQRSENSVFRPKSLLVQKAAGEERLDVYKRILWVDFVVSAIALVLAWGNWGVLASVSSILALLVYATPSVTLAALCRHKPADFPQPFAYVSGFSFVALAVVFVLSTEGVPRGMGVLVLGCALLFGIPALFPGARWYDARAVWSEFTPRKDKAARLAAVLGGYFAVLALADTIRCHLPQHTPRPLDIAGLVAVAAISFIAFRWMVGLSAEYMGENPPLLPKPFPGRDDLVTERQPEGQMATETGS